MFSSYPSKSLAGTWGNEIKQKSYTDKPPGKVLTITRESYNTINIMKEKEHIKNKFVKFVSDCMMMIILCCSTLMRMVIIDIILIDWCCKSIDDDDMIMMMIKSYSIRPCKPFFFS